MKRPKKPTPPLTPMYEKVSDVLARNTKDFWQLALEGRGHIDTNMTTGQAIKAVSSLQRRLGPQRLLSSRVEALADTIIDGIKRKPKLPQSNNVRLLHG